MYDGPDVDDNVRSASCSIGMTQQTPPAPHPRAWMDPYIRAAGKRDEWILKAIKRDGYLDDLCRHPGIGVAIERLNHKFMEAGMQHKLVYKDGDNQLWLEEPK